MPRIDGFEEIVEALEICDAFFIVFEKDKNISAIHANMDTVLACDMIKALIVTTEEEITKHGKYSPELEIARHAIQTFIQRITSDAKGLLLAEGITDMMNKSRWN